ncbi:hypothetical protein ASE48_08535 [Mycobacterium sp. Root265]|uniref:hypothetical protein n=1 Tax=Mycobacterium sp. Root265 TaxID=1736504 RepID=UPI00070E0DBD|nr:hypothetical protein [Mycobacterium sp. Root265]KRD08601.1 hypothetical protein ASE48_08535 [Mycobacterium sp. Root265]
MTQTIFDFEDIEELVKSPDRANRVHRAAWALDHYVILSGRDVIETGISDLMADLLHLAEAADMDIDSLIDSARTNYDEERDE